ncbi:hypothetical protein ACP4OV_027715 [Aristida adscensionis]
MAAMMSDDDDDVEPRVKAVQNYYFVDDNDSAVSFGVLPFQFDAAEEVPSFKMDVYLRGVADGGRRSVYKQVVAWKLGLSGDSPEITVLCTEGSWIVLLKPRPVYEETVRSLLIAVEMLHFVRRSPAVSEEETWVHLRRVFGKYEVKPSEDDLMSHVQLIKLFAERDPAIAESKTLQRFLKERSTVKINEVGSHDLEMKHPFVADDKEREEMVEDDYKHEPSKDDNDDDVDEDEEDEDLFDSVCSICDNGGDLLCCEGSCMRSFHAKRGDGEDSYCATLGYTLTEFKAIKNFLCKNCEYKQHQCFVCGKLEHSDGPNAKVFLCNNATCGHYYHPNCVAKLLHPNNRNEASELQKKIVAGFSFTCPVHWCFECKGLEDRTQEPLQFAVCRRCPRSYHRKCLPREISFEDNDELGIITRAWELSKRILIYCLDHDIDIDIGTPSRDHLKFPHTEKPVSSVKNKVKELAEKKRRTFGGSCADEPVQKCAKRLGTKGSFEQHGFEPEKKKAECLKDMMQPKESLVIASSPKQPSKEQGNGSLSLLATRKIPESSFPVVDTEMENRVIALVEKEVSSLTLDDISRRFAIPSTYAASGRRIDKILAWGKLERSVEAVKAALQKLDNGGTVDDAKAVCEAEVLKQLTRWNNKLKVYLAPFIHGTRYTSFGRHFTKKEKLTEIVDKLHWYVQPGDTIVDFSCGENEFSQFMKEKLDKVGKRCNFKNYDVIRPKNSFCFEKRDWMTVRPKELPHGSKLIMGLNPPFGLKAMLANKFIDKALTFKPKLIILIAPKETERLDQKRQPYDLVWEDTGSLSGKSFYLPGSLDVTDKQIDQWNACPPPLYLWSRPDWTQKHKKIAEEHGHTTLMENHGVPYEQTDISGEEKETYTSGHTNLVLGKPKQVNELPPEKQVEVAYEETKIASNRSDPFRTNQSSVCCAEGVARSDFKIDCSNGSRDAIKVSNCSIRDLEERGDAKEAYSAISISPSDSRNSRHKSRNDSPCLDSEYPSERIAYQGNYSNNPVRDPCTSPRQRVPYEDYLKNVCEYGVASVEKHLAFSTNSVSADSRMQTPGLKEMAGLYGDGPTSNTYNSVSVGTGGIYSSQNIDRSVDYGSAQRYVVTGRGVQDNTGSAQRYAVADRDVEDARMYGRHFRDDHVQSVTTATDVRSQVSRVYGGHMGDLSRTAMSHPEPDNPAQLRMYRRQGTHTSGYPASSDVQFALTSSPYGISPLGSVGMSATDRYAPRLHETNYTRGPYSAPHNRRDMAPDPLNLASRQQYPNPHPGSSGGWLN